MDECKEYIWREKLIQQHVPFKKIWKVWCVLVFRLTQTEMFLHSCSSSVRLDLEHLLSSSRTAPLTLTRPFYHMHMLWSKPSIVSLALCSGWLSCWKLNFHPSLRSQPTHCSSSQERSAKTRFSFSQPLFHQVSYWEGVLISNNDLTERGNTQWWQTRWFHCFSINKTLMILFYGSFIESLNSNLTVQSNSPAKQLALNSASCLTGGEKGQTILRAETVSPVLLPLWWRYQSHL